MSETPIPSPDDETFRVLVTVDLSRDDHKDLQPVEMISGAEVVLLGMYPITDQVSPEQAREQFGEEAQDALDQLTDRFRQANLDVESSLVFAVDLKEAINRVATKETCHAILTWNDQLVFSRLAVFHRGDKEMDRIMNNVALMMAEQPQEVHLIHFYDEGTDPEEVGRRRKILDEQREFLIERGVGRDQIEIIFEKTADVNESLKEAAAEYDALVMGETEPSMASRLFGLRHELVTEHASGTVLIVRTPFRDT